MCNQHSTTSVLVAKPGQREPIHVGVDDCIAPLVALLNQFGYPTAASCCGHNRRPGTIALRDGRELIITRGYDEARSIDAFIDTDIHPAAGDTPTEGERITIGDLAYIRHVPLRGWSALASDMVWRATHRRVRSWDRCVMGYHHPLSWCPRPKVPGATWSACSKHLPLFPAAAGDTP